MQLVHAFDYTFVNLWVFFSLSQIVACQFTSKKLIRERWLCKLSLITASQCPKGISSDAA